MKLALLGHPVSHSLSPRIYQGLLGLRLEKYDLLDCPEPDFIPSLMELQAKYDGLNVTSPYKKHFVDQVKWEDPGMRELGALNALSFSGPEVIATNTDFTAILEILRKMESQHGPLDLIVLGDGVMGKITEVAADFLRIPWRTFSRRVHGDISQLPLSDYSQGQRQSVVINACSRNFIFSGKLHPDSLFWDYNYSFEPHSKRIPPLVKSYQDGQEMLFLQAKAALDFWRRTNPKLKC